MSACTLAAVLLGTYDAGDPAAKAHVHRFDPTTAVAFLRERLTAIETLE